MMDSLGLSRTGVEKIVKKLKQERRIAALDQIRAGIGGSGAQLGTRALTKPASIPKKS